MKSLEFYPCFVHYLIYILLFTTIVQHVLSAACLHFRSSRLVNLISSLNHGTSGLALKTFFAWEHVYQAHQSEIITVHEIIERI